MYIEIVDSLRCPAPHEETWLVASVTRLDGRDIVDGILGCPVCRRQFAVRAGEVDFTSPPGVAGEALTATPVGRELGRERHDVAGDRPLGGEQAESVLLRARALLGLVEGGGLVVLGGERARMAPALEDEAQVMPLLLNAPPSAWRDGRYPSAIRVAEGLPMAAGTVRAAWLDASTATPAMVATVARALRPGGRLVVPVRTPLPSGVRELARDDQEWVAEWEGGASAPVPIRRR